MMPIIDVHQTTKPRAYRMTAMRNNILKIINDFKENGLILSFRKELINRGMEEIIINILSLEIFSGFFITVKLFYSDRFLKNCCLAKEDLSEIILLVGNECPMKKLGSLIKEKIRHTLKGLQNEMDLLEDGQKAILKYPDFGITKIEKSTRYEDKYLDIDFWFWDQEKKIPFQLKLGTCSVSKIPADVKVSRLYYYRGIYGLDILIRKLKKIEKAHIREKIVFV